MKTLTVEQAAEVLHCHPQTVLKMARRGDLPGSKPGKRWVFLPEDLTEFIRSGQYGRPCQSSAEKAHPSTTSGSPRRTEAEYSNLLGLPAGETPKNTKPSLKLVSGESTS